MINFDENNKDEILYTFNQNITIENAKKLMDKNNKDYLVVLDRQRRLEKLAFRKDFDEIKVASAISTHPGWQKRAKAIIEAGAELIGANCGNGIADMIGIVEEIRKANKDIPILVHANAGMPIYDDGKTVFPETPDEWQIWFPELLPPGQILLEGVVVLLLCTFREFGWRLMENRLLLSL